MRLSILYCLLLIAPLQVYGQQPGAGTKRDAEKYQNPVIHADYSDPDVIAVGDDFYLIASSFDAVPGIPILHSKDLVHWAIIGHALQQQVPLQLFDKTQHGKGVWAPAIRFHNNEFYIFYPDPDQGIYLIKAKKITGPWSAPVLIEAGQGLIDPCPLWDDNGKVYLVHAFAGSRAGFKSLLVVKELNAAADKVIGNAVLVYDGHDTDPTIEGPKLYKRNGYYYIFAPAGGVGTGWQTVLRSKSIYGPYERRVVMQQGNTNVNGPHQGAWIHTSANEDWFIHFQDKDAYGRVLHLQPMQWKNNWPVIGEDKDGDGIGEPVTTFTMPATTKKAVGVSIPDSDEFNDNAIGLQWQWQANPAPYWAFPFPAKGVLRMNAVLMPVTANNLWDVPAVLMQKFPSETFTATTKLSFYPKLVGEKFGLVVMGTSYAGLCLIKKEAGICLSYTVCENAEKGNRETEKLIKIIDSADVYLRLTVEAGAGCRFSYSVDGVEFSVVDEKFKALPGRWTGAKFGFVCAKLSTSNDSGFADVDWVRLKK